MNRKHLAELLEGRTYWVVLREEKHRRAESVEFGFGHTSDIENFQGRSGYVFFWFSATIIRWSVMSKVITHSIYAIENLESMRPAMRHFISLLFKGKRELERKGGCDAWRHSVITKARNQPHVRKCCGYIQIKYHSLGCKNDYFELYKIYAHFMMTNM